MNTKCVHFLAISISLFLLSYRSQAQLNTSDSLALVDFYNNTNGDQWKKNTNWLTLRPVSTWYGVSTAARRVTALSLSTNRVKGTLPESFGNLTQLTTVNLRNNGLQSYIPSSIGNLTQLTYLDLSYNQLYGAIPSSIGNLTELTTLHMNYNKLGDTIPASIGNLVKLTGLYLEFNKLTGSNRLQLATSQK